LLHGGWLTYLPEQRAIAAAERGTTAEVLI
jgi:hypothetical protein